jgi:hypothetical protein
MRNVTITAVMNGFTVQVGCQTLVFNTREELLRELDAYLADPKETERRYRQRFRVQGSEGVEAAAAPRYNETAAECATDNRMVGASIPASIPGSRW